MVHTKYMLAIKDASQLPIDHILQYRPSPQHPVPHRRRPRLLRRRPHPIAAIPSPALRILLAHHYYLWRLQRRMHPLRTLPQSKQPPPRVHQLQKLGQQRGRFERLARTNDDELGLRTGKRYVDASPVL
jgi:hypothetical protein